MSFIIKPKYISESDACMGFTDTRNGDNHIRRTLVDTTLELSDCVVWVLWVERRDKYVNNSITTKTNANLIRVIVGSIVCDKRSFIL